MKTNIMDWFLLIVFAVLNIVFLVLFEIFTVYALIALSKGNLAGVLFLLSAKGSLVYGLACLDVLRHDFEN